MAIQSKLCANRIGSEFLFDGVNVGEAERTPVAFASQFASVLPSLFAAGFATVGGLSSIGSALGSIPLSMSCFPLIIPVTLSSVDEETRGFVDSEQAKHFVRGLHNVCLSLASFALIDFMFGDYISALLNGGFAVFGYYASRRDGVQMLPSFVITAFVNGCVSSTILFESLSSSRSAFFAGRLPLYVNYVHLERIAIPVLCFGGAYMGWQIVKALRLNTAAFPGVLTQDEASGLTGGLTGPGFGSVPGSGGFGGQGAFPNQANRGAAAPRRREGVGSAETSVFSGPARRLGQSVALPATSGPESSELSDESGRPLLASSANQNNSTTPARTNVTTGSLFEPFTGPRATLES